MIKLSGCDNFVLKSLSQTNGESDAIVLDDAKEEEEGNLKLLSAELKNPPELEKAETFRILRLM